MLRQACVWVLGVSLVFACEPSVSKLVVGEVEYVTGEGSGEPNLFAASDGRAFLTWLEPVGADGYALRFAARDAGEWSEPVSVVESGQFFVNWADFPSLVQLDNGDLLVHWLEKMGPETYAYHVRLALSDDGGATWSDATTPHRDTSSTEHGFVSMVPWEGGAALVWLDGREMKSEAEAAGQDDLDRGDMSIRFTTFGPDGDLGPDMLLDPRTCECCQTSLAKVGSGLLAAYRDRSDAEIRNIAVVRYDDGRWSEPTHVADDNWYYPGCPVNGPQLSALGDTVVVTWFTAPEQKPAVYAAFSSDGGRSFGGPIRLDEGDPLGRVDIEILEDGRAVVSWLERSAAAAEVRVRLVGRDGRLGRPVVVAETAEARASGFPRIVLLEDELLVAWTVVGDSGEVRVASVRFH